MANIFRVIAAAKQERERAREEERRQVSELKDRLIRELRASIESQPDMPRSSYDEVFPNCFLGDSRIAMNRTELKKLGITHVLNSAKGAKFSQINTNQAFYNSCGIKFMGVDLLDVETCKIEAYFASATQFMDKALRDIGGNNGSGKVLVHCFMGVSRSATFVLAYLMLHRRMRLEEAFKLVLKKRRILPNDGFLAKLLHLEKQLLLENKL